MRALTLLLLAAGPVTWDFEKAEIDKPPAGFEFATTAKTPAGQWVVTKDGEARVLSQLDTDKTSGRFALAMVKESSFKDLKLSVRAKPVSGEVDQAAGLVWRYQDQDNYYLVRSNVLESNVRLYRVVKGNRTKFAGKDEVKIKAGEWHRLRIEHQGTAINVGGTENELESLARTLNATFDRLEASMKRLGQFTADAAHELRTPITVLMTQMELALKKERSSQEYREALETCLKTVRRMADLAERLLFLSRADAGAIEWRRESFDLEEVVEETIHLVQPLADSRGIAITRKLEPHRVFGDKMRLGEAVMNLLTNAIQHNRSQGSVEVSLSAGVLSVADTGMGIPQEDRPHLFERFYRADKARSRNAGGAGLGLAITKVIVEGHGGSIDFESRNGNGTVFRIRLPAATT